MTAAQTRRAVQLLRLLTRFSTCSQDGTETCRGLGLVPERWCVSCEANAFVEQLDEHQDTRQISRRRQ